MKPSTGAKALAKRLFIESRGSRSVTDIAREVGLSRETVSRLKSAEGWDAELAETEAKALDSVKTEIVTAYQAQIENLETLNKKIEDRLKAKTLKAPEISALSRAMGEIVKTLRLIRGQSTDNSAVHVTSTDVETPRDHRTVNKALLQAARTGNVEIQAALAKWIEALQAAVEVEQAAWDALHGVSKTITISHIDHALKDHANEYQDL